MSVGEPCAKEEYIASGGSTRSSQISNLERNIALYIQRARDYLNWWDGESAVFWAEKAVALSIDHHNISENDKIKPFKNGTSFTFKAKNSQSQISLDYTRPPFVRLLQYSPSECLNFVCVLK